MVKKGFIFKTTALVLVFAAGAAELGLRWATKGSPQQTTFDLRGQTLNLLDAEIICIGNSPTAANANPPGTSYCSQLQTIAEDNGKKIRIQNWGVPMFNTSDILKDIEKKLPPAKPRVALVMAGETNFFKFQGYSSFVKEQLGESTSGGSSSLWSSLKEKSALLHFLAGRSESDEQNATPSKFPFPVVNEENSLELAYRWLSWARTHFPTVVLTDEQAKLALASMQKIKELDSGNVAADLVAGEIQAIHFHDFEKALKHFEAVPKSHEACLAFLESPNFETSTLKGSGPLVQYFARIWRVWSMKFKPEELLYVRKILTFSRDRKNAADFMPTDFNQKSKNLKHLIETLNDCGTPTDTTVYLLALADMQREDHYSVFSRMERHLRFFPLTPHIDAFQWINGAESVLPESAEFKQRIENQREDFKEKFGDQISSNILPPKSEIERWTRTELTEIAQFFKSRGVRVVMMTYPPQPFSNVHPIKGTPVEFMPGQRVDEEIRQVASAEKLPIFDTTSILRERFRNTNKAMQFYSFKMGKLDMHLNPEGDRILAEELYNFLDREKLLEAKEL